MRHALVGTAFAAGLGACTYIYGLDDFEGQGEAGPSADAGTDATTSSDAPANGEGGGPNPPGDAGSDAAPADPCTNGVIAYWPMDEGSGTDVLDRCSNHLDGKTNDGETGSVTWGKRGNSSCILLDGDGFVSFGQTDTLRLGGAFTVAGFFRSDGAPSGYSSLFWNYADSRGSEITLSYDNELYVSVGCGPGIGTFLPFPEPVAGVWMHLAAVFEPGVRLEVFVNGKSVGNTTNVCTPATSLSETRFGAIGDTKWTGAVDDLIVYSRALSAQEIVTLSQR